MQGIFRTWFLTMVTVMKSSGQVIIVAENIIDGVCFKSIGSMKR